MATLDALLEDIVADPDPSSTWLVLADWLEEHDDPRRAELLRLHRRLLASCCEPDEHPGRGVWQARIVELLAEGVKPCVPQRTVTLAEGVEMIFSFIPPGTFLMGTPASEPDRVNDETQHRVTLTKGFYLGIHQVTQAQWQAVMGGNPSHFKGGSLPVESVSLDDCHEFIEMLGEETGQRFGLPTEAEWEYSCRAGTTTPFYFGETISTDQANYNSDYAYGKGKKGVSRQKTTPVGSFPANAWGLFDMPGNVCEYCSDWYGEYPSEDIRDPHYVDNNSFPVRRGGRWCNHPWFCRSAFRDWGYPGLPSIDCGCRVLLCLD